MTLFHAATKSCTNFCFRVITGIHFGQGAELGVRAEDEVDGRAHPLHLAVPSALPS